jgi:hypothetical protein
MKSFILKAYIYLNVFIYLFDASFRYFAEAAGRVFSPDNDVHPPQSGVQPYGGDYYSKWG